MADKYAQVMQTPRQSAAPDPFAMMSAIKSNIMNSADRKTLKSIYDQVSAYYDNPKAFSNEQLEAIRATAASYGVEVPLSARDKATALEQVGTAIVGFLDGMVLDAIPDDYYSSRRTATARTIGNYAGIIIPAVVATIGSMGASSPAVGAALAKIGIKGGAKKAALKLGGPEGKGALRAVEEGLSRASRALTGAAKYTPTGYIGANYAARGIRGIGQALSKFGPTAGVGEKIMASKLGITGAKKAAQAALDDAAKLAKKGDIDGVTESLGAIGDDIMPYIGDATESLIKSGKIKGAAADVLKDATSKFGRTNFADDALDDIAKGFMGYKKAGKAGRTHASNFMDSLRNGLSKGDSIEDIIKSSGIPKSRATAIRKMYKDPEQRAELLKKLAENSPEVDATIFSGLKEAAPLAGFSALELGLGINPSSEEIDDGLPL